MYHAILHANAVRYCKFWRAKTVIPASVWGRGRGGIITSSCISQKDSLLMQSWCCKANTIAVNWISGTSNCAMESKLTTSPISHVNVTTGLGASHNSLYSTIFKTSFVCNIANCGISFWGNFSVSCPYLDNSQVAWEITRRVPRLIPCCINLQVFFSEQRTLDSFFVSFFLSVLGLAVFALQLTVDVLGFRKPAHRRSWNFNLYQQSFSSITFTLLVTMTAKKHPVALKNKLVLHSQQCAHWKDEMGNIKELYKFRRLAQKKLDVLKCRYLWWSIHSLSLHWLWVTKPSLQMFRGSNIHLHVYLRLL